MPPKHLVRCCGEFCPGRSHGSRHHLSDLRSVMPLYALVQTCPISISLIACQHHHTPIGHGFRRRHEALAAIARSEPSSLSCNCPRRATALRESRVAVVRRSVRDKLGELTLPPTPARLPQANRTCTPGAGNTAAKASTGGSICPS